MCTLVAYLLNLLYIAHPKIFDYKNVKQTSDIYTSLKATVHDLKDYIKTPVVYATVKSYFH